ncbi:META domain-containing protein [Paraferrimonas sp. SM1919]|uniref:META domain-containing protein n=1 Tax=Paraferrimonas sp. SM1919 TaxID=2662263 RepID=UPI0013CFE64B|nr:META domain-containing protein [Paraferrimonas sp. SM1919]
MNKLYLLVFVAIAFFMQGCSQLQRPKEIALSGQVVVPKIYNISANAKLVVSLRDDRLQDVSSRLIATKTYPWSDNLQVHFFVPSHLKLSDLSIHVSVIDQGKRLLLNDSSISANKFGLSEVKLIATEAAKQSLLLAPSQWQLVRVDGKPNLSLVTLNLDGERSLTGHSNCNRYSAQYSLEQHDFTIAKLINSKRFCPQMKQEINYLKALKRVSNLRINNRDQLVLADDNNKPILIFRHK